jgi:septal ring factor EnvC (AmiA/AmiB activator)
MDIEKIRHENIERLTKSQSKEKAKPVESEIKKEKTEETNTTPVRFRIENDFKLNAELEKEIARLSAEVRKIEQQKNVYAENLAEIRRAISESGDDPAKISIKLKEMNSIKYEIQQAEIERMRMISELRQKIAEGGYRITGMDIVKRWFE